MKKYKILIADDVPDMRTLIMEMISPVCEVCLEANDGKELITLLEEHDDIDVILTDIEMPEMDGFEAVNHIRNVMSEPKNKTPIIAITAYYSMSFATRCQKMGINHVISKPFYDEQIIAAIEKCKK